MTWLEKLRLGFLGRSRREKLLAMLFLVVLAGIWAMLLSGRVRTFFPRWTEVHDRAADQKRVLSGRDQIDQRYATAYERLSATADLRPSGKVAYETVDRVLRGSGVDFRMDPAQPERRDQLTFHPINLNITKANYEKLAEVFRTITTQLPTVNLAEVVISVSDRNSPNLLNARFRFVAIEINR